MSLDRSVRSYVLAACCAAVAACSNGTEPVVQDQTVESLLADISSVETQAAFGGAFLGMPALPSLGTTPVSCVFTAATKNFVCPPVTIPSGFTFSRSYQLLDASGAPLSAFNASTVASIRTVTDLSGTTTMAPQGATPSVTMKHTSHADQTLSGLLTTTRTLNGTGNSSSTITSQGISTSFTSTQKIERLVLPQPGSAKPYPASGTITMEAAFPGLVGGAPETFKMVMTYNGTSIMTMTMTIGGRTTSCSVDMSKRGQAPSCSG